MQAFIGLFSLHEREWAKWALSGTFSHQRLAACGRPRSWLYLWALMGGAELHFLHGTLLWAVCVGEGTVKACHQEPLPPVIYQGRMCFGGLDESLFPEPYVCCCVWALLKITIRFQLHSFCRFFSIVSIKKKKNHTSITHTHIRVQHVMGRWTALCWPRALVECRRQKILSSLCSCSLLGCF